MCGSLRLQGIQLVSGKPGNNPTAGPRLYRWDHVPTPPCDIIEGNGHVMSTMSRYPRDARKGRVLCGFLRVLRSGAFIRPKFDSWQGVGLLCLHKGALLRLSSSLPVMPERESLGKQHESAPTCAFRDDNRIQASWGPPCSV